MQVDPAKDERADKNAALARIAGSGNLGAYRG
jgi:hypothetical protein